MNGTTRRGSTSYGSESAYNPQSAYYNPYALGNMGFTIPSGMGQQPSPVSTAIGGQMGGMPGVEGQRSPYGGFASNYNFPGGMGGGGGMTMDPRYFGQMYAPMQLEQQRQQFYQANIASAIERAKGLLGGMGMPAEGGLGDLERWAEQRTALESQPIKKAKQESLRSIEDQWARKGSALGSEHERNVAEIEGASLAAMRSSSIAAAIDAFMKRPQLLAGLIAASR